MRTKVNLTSITIAVAVNCAGASAQESPGGPRGGFATPPVIRYAVSRSQTVFNEYQPTFATPPVIREAISRTQTVSNGFSVPFANPPVIRESISRAHTIYNAFTTPFANPPVIREAISRPQTVLNEFTIPFANVPVIREAISRTQTIFNLYMVPFSGPPTIREAISRTQTVCNSAGDFNDADSDGVFDCADLCPGFNDALDADADTVPNGCDQCPGFDDRLDCNSNNVPDGCDISGPTSTDVNMNGLPDDCETDCNSNGASDLDDILAMTSQDCNSNETPDECEIDAGSGAPGGPFYCVFACLPDCNDNGLIDVCELPGSDCNTNGVLDECDIAGSTSDDCDNNLLPDSCQPDCNTNGVADPCDIAGATSGDCDGSGVPDECEGPSGTGLWIGPDGGLFMDGANWNPAGVPSGGSDALFSNTTGVDNTCVLNAPGTTGVCAVALEGLGAGQQILEIDEDSTLSTVGGVDVRAGGEVYFQGGEITGGPVTNAANTLSGYGEISADVSNGGLIEAVAGTQVTFLFSGDTFENLSTGFIRATVASAVLVRSTTVTQAGRIEVRSNATVSFATPLTNEAGARIDLLDGTLDATETVFNLPGALVYGTGIIDATLENDGDLVTIANMILIGDLVNEGVTTIQNGLFTVAGNVSGSGTIIGSFGGRDAEPSGMEIRGNFEIPLSGSLSLQNGVVRLNGDFDVGLDDPSRFDLSTSALEFVTSTPQRLQSLEVLSADAGGRDVERDDAGRFWIGQLRIGESASVRLADHHGNSGGRGAEVLYVDELLLEPGATLDLAGLGLYYRTITPPPSSFAESNVQVLDSNLGGFLCRLDLTLDLDGDCDADADDMTAFVEVLLGSDVDPTWFDPADVNRDGFVDGADIQAFVDHLTTP